MGHAGAVYASLGRRVRSLRERARLTQGELARGVGLTRTSITNIEGGRQKILLHTLYDIAEALGAPLEDLLPPVVAEPTGEISALLPDGLTPEEREWVWRLLDKGLRRRRGSGVEVGAIRESAEGLLSRFGVDGPPVDVELLARGVGVRLGYEPLEGELSGLLFRGEDRAIIGVNELQPRSRQRFAIAHELGHLRLHEPTGHAVHVDRKFVLSLGGDRSARAPSASEDEANAFAVDLLMPAGMLGEDLVGRAVDYEDDGFPRLLAERYGVSPQAMAFRLADLGQKSVPDAVDERRPRRGLE